jgi:hypothetical protein
LERVAKTVHPWKPVSAHWVYERKQPLAAARQYGYWVQTHQGKVSRQDYELLAEIQKAAGLNKEADATLRKLRSLK